MPLHPTVLWAQRGDLIYLTVQVTDIRDPKISVTADKFHFNGKGEAEHNEYEVDIDFYDEVDVEKSKQNLTDRNLTMIIYKKKEGYWPRLQKGAKLNFVKADFARWRDEDDDEEEDGAADPMGGMDFQSLMSQAGGGSFPDMPDEDYSSSDDGLEDEEEKKDDEKAEEKTA